MAPEQSITAKDLLDPDGVIVSSGERLATAVVAALEHAQTVNIDLRGMPPISSTYFNVVLRTVRDQFGHQAVERVVVSTPSSIIQSVFDRSKTAFLSPVIH